MADDKKKPPKEPAIKVPLTTVSDERLPLTPGERVIVRSADAKPIKADSTFYGVDDDSVTTTVSGGVRPKQTIIIKDSKDTKSQDRDDEDDSDGQDDEGKKPDKKSDKDSGKDKDSDKDKNSGGKRELSAAPSNAKDSAEENPEQQHVNAWTSPITYVLILVAITGSFIILYAWRLWPFDLPVESTDDSYIHGNVTTIAPQVSGQILSRPADDFLYVKAGDLLVQIDDRTYRQKVAMAKASLIEAQVKLDQYDNEVMSDQASLDLARAKLVSAEADMVQKQLDLARVSPLEATGVASHAQGDEARVNLSEAQASVNEAKANVESAKQALEMEIKNLGSLKAEVLNAEAELASAELNLAHTRVLSPVDGQLGNVGVEAGQLISSGSSITTVTPKNVWVIANFKETQLMGMRMGQPVTFTVDALNYRTYRGYISLISPATGSEYSMVKSNNATGNFTKVVQRVPIRIEIERGQDLAELLRPGLSVEVRIDKSLQPLETLPPDMSDNDHPIVYN